ncbi:hypothetical protein JYT87_03215 [Nitrospira defluvii]|nr:hypothetical protein [Nitrospira defluvii]
MGKARSCLLPNQGMNKPVFLVLSLKTKNGWVVDGIKTQLMFSDPTSI